MTTKKKRQRGSKTHGGGSMKKRRGAGHRGGRGKAGTGKKGDSKKPSYWKDAKKKGFVSQKQKAGKPEAINIQDINETLDTLEKEEKITKKGDTYQINLKELGYGKLLGKGKPKEKYSITVDKASGSAVRKVEDAGGEVTLEAQEASD